VLKTEYTDNETLTYLIEHGYYCGVICKDIFEESDKINKIASLICKKAQSKGLVRYIKLYISIFDF